MAVQRLFSRRVGYAVHALCLIAQKEPWAAIPVTELAAQMAVAWPETSPTYLAKVVQALVQGGILASLRGSAGGYGFAHSPDQLSLLDVMVALEGPFDSSCPLTPSGPCRFRERCTNLSELRRLQNDILSLLSTAKIDRLARNLPAPLPTGDAHAAPSGPATGPGSAALPSLVPLPPPSLTFESTS